MWADVQQTICFICLSLWQENVLVVFTANHLGCEGKVWWYLKPKQNLSQNSQMQGIAAIWVWKYFKSTFNLKKTKFPETHRSLKSLNQW